jgi:hypothetical protein
MGESKRQDEVRRETSFVYYDLTSIEAGFRAELASIKEQGEAAIAAGRAEPHFINAQRCFDEARVQFVLGGMKATNDGIPRDEMLGAAAMALGLMHAGLLKVCIGNRERDQVKRFYEQSLIDALQAPAPGDSEVQANPMQAGHA